MRWPRCNRVRAELSSAGQCARAVIAELISWGVRDVVLAPGSRSAPLAYEVFEADRTGQLRLHVRIDERTGAFLALGLVKASGRVVPVITTSGTAAANLHPAVLEASHSHLPLMVITADRPQSLINTGANQTTQQDQLFGSHVRTSASLADAAGNVRAWRFEVSRLAAAAAGIRSRLPGPVHLNVSFSEPLTPDLAESSTPREPPAGAPNLPSSRPAEALRLGGDPATVVLVGDAPPDTGRAACEVAAMGGFPLLAEPSSNARRGPEAISCYRLLLATELAADIERVIVFGHPTLSRPVSRLLGRTDVEVVVVSDYADWVDPGLTARTVVDAVRANAPADYAWLERWCNAERRLRPALDQLLDEQDVLTGQAVARAVWRKLTEQDTLVAGSSNPIRDLDLAPITSGPPIVHANRGLSGIDGTLSTAIGIALGAGRPTHALVGDLTFLHDITALMVGADEPRADLRIVVANDGGGSIFATLEQGEPALASAFERVFATPQQVDLAGLSAALGAGYALVGGTAELGELISAAPHGIEVVEARIDRDRRRALDRAIQGLAGAM
jgi:2-succinyl-5-enolpyruvyl-6-hydroxy-3-cyclohexene-1-carboxylate synthase